jgi:hypothetical protein
VPLVAAGRFYRYQILLSERDLTVKRILRLSTLAGGIVVTASLALLLPTPASAQKAYYGYGQAYDGAYIQRYYGGYIQPYYGGYGRSFYGGYGRGYVSPYDPGVNRYSGFGNGPYIYVPSGGYAYRSDAVYGNPAYYGRSYGRADAAYGSRVYSPYGYGPY